MRGDEQQAPAPQELAAAAAAAPRSTAHSAPWVTIPDQRFICVEHPAVVRDLDNAIATIGGPQALVKLASTDGASSLQLRFRPDDPMPPAIESRIVPTTNVLVKITIPRRKKNKGDISKPKTLLDKIQASDGNYKIEALGRIEKTVRFREIADFQWNSHNIPFVNKFQKTVLTCKYEHISKFTLSPEAGSPDIDTLPPPSWSQTSIPHTFNYRQNPAIKKALIDGKTALLNFQAGPKTLTPMVHSPSAQIPSRPPTLPDYSQLDGPIKEAVDQLHILFAERPIWTRRALFNQFPKHLQGHVRFSMAHVGYMWRAGPWRDTCVAYGVDPRRDSKYRFHQSLFFQMDAYRKNPEILESEKDTHVFDGRRVTRDGRVFQMCDITDAQLQSLINTEAIRAKCDLQDGWYRSSTLLKIRTLMRAKFRCLSEGTSLSSIELQSILDLPSEDDAEEKARREREPKARGKRKKTRRGAMANFVGERASTPDTPDPTPGVEREEDEEAEEQEGGEWEQVLESPADEKVKRLMEEYMSQARGEIGFDVEPDGGDEGEFDVLGNDDEDE